MVKLLIQKYDLHTHTTASDGKLTPGESVALAKEIGLAGIAITDHDTVAGVADAFQTGEQIGVDVVPGVEISTSADDADIHMLGLWINPDDPVLIERLADNRKKRGERNVKVIAALRSLGFDVTLEEAENIAAENRNNNDRSVSRPHIAELLVRKGYAASIEDAFHRYLVRGRPAHVKVRRIAPEVAIEWIHEAGGIAVIAHPGLYRTGDLLIEQLVEHGLDGIEAAHADHDLTQEHHYKQMAERFQLITTAGSDFHGFRDGAAYHSQLGSKTVDDRTIDSWRGTLRPFRELRHAGRGSK